jgi:hypothetical protein
MLQLYRVDYGRGHRHADSRPYECPWARMESMQRLAHYYRRIASKLRDPDDQATALYAADELEALIEEYTRAAST